MIIQENRDFKEENVKKELYNSFNNGVRMHLHHVMIRDTEKHLDYGHTYFKNINKTTDRVEAFYSSVADFYFGKNHND